MAYRIDKHPAKAFEAGGLYIVASLPRRLPYAQHNLARYPISVPEAFDAGSYETNAATGRASEEFEWSIYYHESAKAGTWFRLVKDLSGYHHGPCPNPKLPAYKLERTKLKGGSLRLQADVVAVFAVMYLPAHMAMPASNCESASTQSSTTSDTDEKSSPTSDTDEQNSPTSPTSSSDEQQLGKGGKAPFNMPLYLDWVTARTSARTTRTFIWAVSIFLRCRLHIAHQIDTGDNVKTFDIKAFLRESLAACYPEVAMASRPVLPRPVFLSGSSVHMLDGGAEEDGSEPVVFAVDSVLLRHPVPEPEPEPEPETPTTTRRSSAVETLVDEGECRPYAFYQPPDTPYMWQLWPNRWPSPKQVYACIDAVATCAAAKNGCDPYQQQQQQQQEQKFDRAVQAAHKTGTAMKKTATYNEEFPPLPPSSAKLGK